MTTYLPCLKPSSPNVPSFDRPHILSSTAYSSSWIDPKASPTWTNYLAGLYDLVSDQALNP
jgi:hypothetical protein